MQCGISKKLFWLRLPCSSGDDDDAGLRAGALKAGASVMVTNMTVAKGSSSGQACRTLQASRNSALKCLHGGTSQAPCDNNALLIHADGMEEVRGVELIDVGMRRTNLLRSELIVTMQVVDWYVEEGDVSNLSMDPFSVVYVRVLGVLRDFVCLDLRFPVVYALLRKLQWLRIGGYVQVSAAQLMEVDVVHGIVRLASTDRTSITQVVVAEMPNSAQQESCPTGAETASAASTMGGKTPKKSRFTTPSKTAARTPLRTPARTAQLSTVGAPCVESTELCEEKSRFSALRSNQSAYVSAVHTNLRLSCAREFVVKGWAKNWMDGDMKVAVVDRSAEVGQDGETHNLEACTFALICGAGSDRISSADWVKVPLLVLQPLEEPISMENCVVRYGIVHICFE